MVYFASWRAFRFLEANVRNVARIKLGYYPLPQEEAKRLRKLLEFSAGTTSVVDPCVGGHFTTALIAGPVFGGAHQSGANFLVARCFVDEPAFDEADWAGWIAAVGMGAQADFDKARECSGFVLRNENGHGERAVHTDA